MTIVLMAVTLIPSLAPEVQAADGTSSGDANDLASIVNGTDGDVVTIDLDKDTTYILTGNSSITKTSVTINGNGATLELASSVQFNAGNGGNNPDSKLVINNLKIVSDVSTVTPIGITFFNWTSVTFDKLDVTNTTVATNDTSNTQTKTNVVEHCTFKGFKDQSARYYALTLNSSTVEVSDCHFYDYSCGLNINMVDGDADSSVTVNGCTFNNMQGKAAVQLGGSVSPSIVLEGNKFLTCSRAAVSIHEGAVGSTTVTSMNNIYSDCGMEFMYCSSTSDVKVVSVSDQFTKGGTASDPVIGGETASVKPPVSNVSVSDGYDPSTGNMTIDSIGDLMAFAAMVNGGNDFQNRTVTLESDLTLTGEWTPIGTEDNPFKGEFYGNDNTISGLTITSTNGLSAQGLFGWIDGASIDKVILADVTINSSSTYIGGVVGYMTGGASVSGCIVNSGTITGTSDDPTESAPIGTGGIVGAAENGTSQTAVSISGCENHAVVNGLRITGGIVGLSSANITSCKNYGDVRIDTKDSSVGGIVGEQRYYGAITECDNYGTVTSTLTGPYSSAGGIVGFVRYVSFSSSPFVSDLKESVSVIGCHNHEDASVSATSSMAGGIVGCAYHSITVDGCINDASVTGTSFVCGIVGGLQTLDEYHNTGSDGCRMVITDNTNNGVVYGNGSNVASIVGQIPNQGTNCVVTMGDYATVYGNTDTANEGMGTGYDTESVAVIVDTDDEGNETVYGFADLVDALSQVDEGGTVTLITEVTTGPLTLSKGITLDLGGFTLRLTDGTGSMLTLTSGDYIIKNGDIVDERNVGNKAVVSVMDNNSLTLIDVDIIFNSAYKANGVEVLGGASLTMESEATITSNGASNLTTGVYLYDSQTEGEPSRFTMKEGASISVQAFGVSSNGTSQNKGYDGSVTVIDGGTITSSNGAGIFMSAVMSVTINGGTITGSTGVEVRAGTLEINGGTITANGQFHAYADSGSGNTVDGVAVAVTQHGYTPEITVDITDGKFNGFYAFYQSDRTAGQTNDPEKIHVDITGGTFTATDKGTDQTASPASVSSEDLTRFIRGGTFLDTTGGGDTSMNSEYLAEGLKVEGDGSIAVDDTDYEAAVYDSEGNFVKAYTTLAEAVENVKTGQTIVLQSEAKLDNQLEISVDGITIDLNDNTITASDSFDHSDPNSSHLINVSADYVTIENGSLVTTSFNKHAVNAYGAQSLTLQGLTMDSSASNNQDLGNGIPLQINGSTVILAEEVTFRGSNTFLNNAIDFGDNVQGNVGLTTLPDTKIHFTDCSLGFWIDVSNATAKVQFGEGTSYDYDGDTFNLTHPYGDDPEVTGFADDLKTPNVTFDVTPSNATVTISQNGEEVEVTTGDGTVELVAGTYDVEYSLTGYVTYNTTVTVGTDNVDVPAHTMKTPEPEPETHSVDFYVHGTLYKHLDIPDGEAIPEDDVPTEPVVEGYMFVEWQCNGMTWKNGAVTEDMRIDAVLYEVVSIGINVTGDAYIGETVTLTPDFDDSAYDAITVMWGYGTTSDISDSNDYGVGESVTATQSGYYFVIVLYTDGTDMFYATGSTHLEFVENPSHGGGDDDPVNPPFIPGDDDVVIPPTVVVDQGSSDDDEAVKIVACAACAVVAAFLAAVMLFHRRD